MSSGPANIAGNPASPPASLGPAPFSIPPVQQQQQQQQQQSYPVDGTVSTDENGNLIRILNGGGSYTNPNGYTPPPTGGPVKQDPNNPYTPPPTAGYTPPVGGVIPGGVMGLQPVGQPGGAAGASFPTGFAGPAGISQGYTGQPDNTNIGLLNQFGRPNRTTRRF